MAGPYGHATLLLVLVATAKLDANSLYKRGDCEVSKCNNRGQCLDVGPYNVCNCALGYSGRWCEKEVCVPNPCQNDGMCQPNLSGNFACECQLDFHGERCDIPVCEPNPCQNSGACSPSPQGNFLCACTDGFEGDQCETATDSHKRNDEVLMQELFQKAGNAAPVYRE